MSLSLIAFLVLVAAFAIGSFTKINAGLLATVAAFVIGSAYYAVLVAALQ